MEKNKLTGGKKFEYGCLMLLLEKDFNEKWAEVQKLIDDEDVYTEESGKGRELEPHTTVLFGFHENSDIEKIKNISYEFMSDMVITVNKVSCFENDSFDVLKLDVEGESLVELNLLMKENFEYTNSFKDYHPHITIAYLKKGTGNKYIGKIKPFTLKPKHYKYSDGKNKSGIFWGD